MAVNRRQLLQCGAAALGSMGFCGQLYGGPSGGPRLLLVFMRGGYDSANLLIPYSSSFYYEARPTIAIARPDPASGIGAVALDDNWALAPAVRDTIGAMYAQRQVAFIPFAGTDDLTGPTRQFGAQLPLGLSRPPGRCAGGKVRGGGADLVHGELAAVLPGRYRRAESLAQERRQATIR